MLKLKTSCFIAMLAVSACDNSRTNVEPTVVSSRLGVCLNLPSSAGSPDIRLGPDFDFGTVMIEGTKTEIYIGFMPDFKGHSWKREYPVRPGFFYIADARDEDGDEQLLLVKRDRAEVGPLFLMLSGHDLSAVRQLAQSKNFAAACDAASAN